MKSSRSTYTVIATLVVAALVAVASNVEVQAGSVAALFGYGTVLTVLALAVSDYRVAARRETAK